MSAAGCCRHQRRDAGGPGGNDPAPRPGHGQGGTCGHVMAGDRGKPQITRGRPSILTFAENKSVYVRVYQRGEKTPGTIRFQGLQTPCAGEKDADAGQGPARRGRRVCAVQAFRRRRNLGGLRPQARFGAQPPQRGGTWRGDGGIYFRRAFQLSTESKKKDTTKRRVLLFGAGNEARTRFPASREWLPAIRRNPASPLD